MHISKNLAVTALAVLLGACGGGGTSSDSGGGSTTTATAEGLWQGTTSDGRSIEGVVLDDGTYWFVYSSAGNSEVIGGAVQGNGRSNNGSFTSANGKDFNLEGLGVNNFTLAGSYVEKHSLSGTLTYAPSGSKTFTSSYDSDYDATPSLAALAGTYNGTAATAAGADSVGATIAKSGALTGHGSGGCTFKGTVAPHSHGNIFDISVTFGGGTCANGTSTVNGVLHYDAASTQINAFALNSDRSDGFIFVGTKS